MLPNGRAHPLDPLSGAGFKSRLCVRRARLECVRRLPGRVRWTCSSLSVLARQPVMMGRLFP